MTAYSTIPDGESLGSNGSSGGACGEPLTFDAFSSRRIVGPKPASACPRGGRDEFPPNSGGVQLSSGEGFSRSISPAGVQSLAHANSLSSFSSAETHTPESSAGGRPSRVSVVDTISPSSRLSPGDRLGYALAKGCSFRADRASAGRFPPQVVDPGASFSTSGDVVRHRLHVPRNPVGMRTVPARICPSEQRRRKYITPGGPGRKSRFQDLHPNWGTAPGAQERIPAVLSVDATPHVDDCEVLVEGPLHQRVFLVFWRLRWCVLDRHELRIYRDEQASLFFPSKPLETHRVEALHVAPDLHFPSVLICAAVPGGEPLIILRTGPGLRWEELVASTLWLRAFNTAKRLAASTPRRGDGAAEVFDDCVGLCGTTDNSSVALGAAAIA
eukprot:CAMPEP_0117525698 /NCGR_PEP_ID=MMETSP0784-20121206/35905_1 /TAXON_ID=39447 /ORGANISM="" /LENGTH=384 /DNA_ID=CAMNT_0005321905 /DNA_START=60 /DNA_END=1214 /DNA_ORIENTATION=-